MHTIHMIQMLRGIAAIMVVLYHLLPQYKAMGGEIAFFHKIFQWGFMGVDIFFIISGFIMAYTTFNKERNIHNAKTFIKHRLFRVYLGYWPFFFTMFFAWLFLSPDKLKSLDIINSFFLTSQQITELVLPVSWSLGYELYFYFLFLFTFLFSKKQLYLYIPSFIGLIFILVFYSYYELEIPKNFYYSPYLLEFFSGILLYMYKDYLMKIWLLPVNIIIIAVSLSSASVSYHAGHEFLRVMTFGTSALLIVHSALILEHNHLYKAGKIFQTLGDASYTLYLSHTIVMIAFYFIGLREVFTSHTSEVLPIIGSLLMIVISIVFSLIYYRKIERPLYQKAINYKRVL